MVLKFLACLGLQQVTQSCLLTLCLPSLLAFPYFCAGIYIVSLFSTHFLPLQNKYHLLTPLSRTYFNMLLLLSIALFLPIIVCHLLFKEYFFPLKPYLGYTDWYKEQICICFNQNDFISVLHKSINCINCINLLYNTWTYLKYNISPQSLTIMSSMKVFLLYFQILAHIRIFCDY